MAVFLPHFSKTACSIVFGFGLSVASFAASEYRGVIDGPDACANVRAEKRSDALVVAKVKTGEPFTFESKRPVPPDDVDDSLPWERKGDEWCNVTLASKKVGWMQCNCIRLLFTKKDWPHGTPSEIAPTYGQEYYKVMRRAEEGDRDALKKFFAFGKGLDGAGAENHDGVVLRVVHILGDARLADFLRRESPAYQAEIRQSFIETLPDAGAPVESVEYLRRHFPSTSKIFFRREIVDWFSPDGRYAIHKVFSDEFDIAHSRVTRTELIERATGSVLSDLTDADTGTGRGREGDVLWAPDSKRFAFLPGNYLREEPSIREADSSLRGLIVYQLLGEVVSRVDLPASVHQDAEKASVPEVKNAVFMGEYIGPKPLRWVKPNVLVFGRDYFYQINDTPEIARRRLSGQEFPYVEPLRRPIDILVTIGADGKVTVERKLRGHE